MRILRFLFTSAIVLGIVGVIAALIGREVLLFMGVSQIRASLSTLKNVSKNAGNYAQQCRQKGAPIESEVISAVQIRFLSDSDYQLEVICNQFQHEPLIVRGQSLPPFVKKIAGSSGIIWGDGPSGIALAVFGRKRAVVVEQEEVFYLPYSDQVTLGAGPITSCQGFGYTCCSAESSEGVGSQLTQASDCPRTCFTSCREVPTVLAFSSDPYVDPASRVAQTKAGEPITFSFVAKANEELAPEVVLDYGDGNQDRFLELIGSSQHIYNCSSGSCQYVVTLTVTTADGAQSRVLPLSSMTVVVNP